MALQIWAIMPFLLQVILAFATLSECSPPHKHKNKLEDYVKECPPQVPTIVGRCIGEIELRGVDRIPGLYRSRNDVSAADRECLKEQFSDENFDLKNTNVYAICTVLKDFLQSLDELLIPPGHVPEFVDALSIRDQKEKDSSLTTAMSNLPGPNRDTLAMLLMHLNSVHDSLDCDISLRNLAVIFGPIVVQSSERYLEPLFKQYRVSIVESLLCLPLTAMSEFICYKSPDASCLSSDSPCSADTGCFKVEYLSVFSKLSSAFCKKGAYDLKPLLESLPDEIGKFQILESGKI